MTPTSELNVFAKYHKIETLFERDERFVVDPSKLRKSVFATISEWDVTEKIDGTNIRVMLSAEGDVTFGGRTDNTQLPTGLTTKLTQMFPRQKMMDAFWLDGKPTQAILFGEGYGAGIQKGHLYRPDQSFILFDVLCGEKWWLERDAVGDVAAKLGIETVPCLGRMTLAQIVDLVRIPFPSRMGNTTAEGVVARPIENLFDKQGDRLILKLKTRDFKPGKR